MTRCPLSPASARKCNSVVNRTEATFKSRALNGSFASVRVCPLSAHCRNEFLRQGRDVPTTEVAASASAHRIGGRDDQAQSHQTRDILKLGTKSWWPSTL